MNSSLILLVHFKGGHVRKPRISSDLFHGPSVTIIQGEHFVPKKFFE